MVTLYALLLLFTLVALGGGFLALWRAWRMTPALFWGLSYLLWAVCQLLLLPDPQHRNAGLNVLAQASFLFSIFFQMHGLQDYAGEPKFAFKTRLVLCIGTTVLTAWLVLAPERKSALFVFRLFMRLALTGSALFVLWRHLGYWINRILFVVVTVMTAFVVVVAAAWIGATLRKSVDLAHMPIFALAQIAGNVIAIIFALTALAALMADITRRYRDDALHDPLSGLPNRRQFESFLHSEWQRALANHEHLSLLMIDVDHFKAYNDEYGHAAGDRCLVRLAEVIRSRVRQQSDLCARVGGEEFVVILPGTTAANAVRAAGHICDAVRAAAVPHKLNPPGIVTVSIGVATAIPAGSYDGTLFESADAGLYKAKLNGRNRVEQA